MKSYFLNVLRVIRIRRIFMKKLCVLNYCAAGMEVESFSGFNFCRGKEKIQHLLNDCYQVQMVDSKGDNSRHQATGDQNITVSGLLDMQAC